MSNTTILKYKPYRNLTCWTFYQEDDYEYVKLFSMHGVIKLNKIGSIIWKLIDDYTSVEDIIQKLDCIFPEIDLVTISNDVIKFLLQLEKEGIIIADWNPLQPYKLEKSKRRC
ncbi:MAG: PqqD family protein [Ignavibacteriaceae bacterium]|jgi:hypothetical protein